MSTQPPEQPDDLERMFAAEETAIPGRWLHRPRHGSGPRWRPWLAPHDHLRGGHGRLRRCSRRHHGNRAPPPGNDRLVALRLHALGVAATGPCTGSTVVGSELGDNALGQVENYLASSLSGNLLIQNATGLLLRLNDVGRAAYRAQKARSYSFDVGVEAFVVSARSTGWLDTRTAALDIDASVGFLELSPGAMNPAGMQRMMLGQNHIATSLTPLNTLPGIEFAKSVQYVGNDPYGRHYRAVVGLSTFAGMIPLADLQGAPSIGRGGSPVPVDVWVNAQGNVSRIAGAFAGGAFTMSLRGQGATRFVPAMAPAQTVGTNAASAGPVSAAATSLVSQSPALPGTSNGVSGVQVGSSTLAIPFGGGVVAPADWYFPTQVDGTIDAQGVIWLQHASNATGGSVASLAADLARQTNSIVVAPSLPNTMNWPLHDASAVRAVASLFVGDRSALVGSAVAAGYAGAEGELTGEVCARRAFRRRRLRDGGRGRLRGAESGVYRPHRRDHGGRRFARRVRRQRQFRNAGGRARFPFHPRLSGCGARAALERLRRYHERARGDESWPVSRRGGHQRGSPNRECGHQRGSPRRNDQQQPIRRHPAARRPHADRRLDQRPVCGRYAGCAPIWLLCCGESADPLGQCRGDRTPQPDREHLVGGGVEARCGTGRHWRADRVRAGARRQQRRQRRHWVRHPTAQ